jgi:hypothetical protein
LLSGGKKSELSAQKMFRERPYKNFSAAVAEGKQRRHCAGQNAASRADRMLLRGFKPCFAGLPKRTDAGNFYAALIFSCFCIKTKGQRIKNSFEIPAFDG